MAAAWTIVDGTLVVRHAPLPRRLRVDLEAEAAALAAFLRTADPGLGDDVRLVEVS